MIGPMNTCQIESCDGKLKARGYCQLHYDRHRKGIPLDGPVRKQRGGGKVCAYGGGSCEKPAWSRGLCHAHYRWHKYGKPSDISRTPIERFARKFTVNSVTGCWEWTDWLNGKGYGLFWVGKKSFAAHRWSYEWHVGLIPEGLTIDHGCYNPRCVNPDHLDPCTQRENTLRSWERRRQNTYHAD